MKTKALILIALASLSPQTGRAVEIISQRLEVSGAWYENWFTGGVWIDGPEGDYYEVDDENDLVYHTASGTFSYNSSAAQDAYIVKSTLEPV